MFGTIAKIMGVVGSLFVHTQPVMFALVMSGTYAMIGGYMFELYRHNEPCLTWVWYRHVVATLPFFHSFMNQFRVAVSFFVSYLWLGSLVFAATPHSSHAILSAAWVPLAVIPIGIALVLPWYRMKSLRLRLCAMRPSMLRELAACHAYVARTASVACSTFVTPGVRGRQTPSEWQARTGSVRVTNAGTLAHTRRARRMSIQALNTRARTSRQRSKALPLSLLEELEANEPQQKRTVFDGMRAHEVELIVRCELDMHGSRDRRKGKWFAQRLVPTTQGVEHVMWLFVQAIEECVGVVNARSVAVVADTAHVATDSVTTQWTSPLSRLRT